VVRLAHVAALMLASLPFLFGAPGADAAMYRCLDADGRMTYTDRPCNVGHLGAGAVDRNGARVPTRADAAELAAADSAAKRAPEAMSPGASAALVDMAEPSLVATACEVLVVQCVQPPVKTLDRCFTAAPRCASARPWLDGSSLACCPQTCVDRYQGLRKSGKAPLQALDIALNGAEGGSGSCVALR
jgi:Domain of unknown function (DUF4124)